MTSSKIKIFSGNFAALLSAQANNGLVLYGKSDSGKSFLKKINSDAIDLDLPNGVWSFYAIAWGVANPDVDSGLRGRVSCGKNLGVSLVGASVTLNMTLSNANCDGSFHPNVESVAGEKKFPSFSVNSCKSLAPVVDGNSGVYCNSDMNNKGTASFIKVVMAEYTKLGLPSDGVFAPAISSRCIEIDGATPSSSASAADASFMSAISLPSGINGMALGIKAYYSNTPCDESTIPDILPLSEGGPTSRVKRFIVPIAGYQSIERVFIETSLADTCKPPRLSPLSFASGKGQQYLPYGVCTNEQLKLIQADFNNQKDKHFELLSDLNFSFNEFLPIGDTASVSDPVNAFTGSFNGNGHRIENVFINCKNFFTSAGVKSGMGFFRYTNGAVIKNITLNKIAVNCDSESTIADNVGMLVGTAYDTAFVNVKSFGFVGGRDNVGGIVGLFDGAGTGEFKDVHVQGAVEGRRYLGGVIGKGDHFASEPNKLVVSQSSFKGEIHGKLKSQLLAPISIASQPGVGGLGDYGPVTGGSIVLSNSLASVTAGDSIYYDPIMQAWRKFKGGTEVPYDAFVGGLAGILTSTNIAKVSEVKIELDKMEGSRLMGGMIGKSDSISLENNYVVGLIKSYHELDGTNAGSGKVKTAGLVGIGTTGSFANNVVAVIKSLNTVVGDSTKNGILGDYQGTEPSCTFNLFLGLTSSGGCNVNFKSIVELVTYSDYDTTFNTRWVFPSVNDGYELPRLSWENLKENEVPYLKRLCSGLYSTQSGTGTQTSPKSICSWTQFLGMSSGNYYELKKNLIYSGAGINGMAPGNYHLDGNNFSLINLVINSDPAVSLNSALFQELTTGSEIKNLKIVSSKISSSNKILGSSGQYNIALLAAKNAGTIKDIEVVDSNVDVVQLSAAAGTSTSNIGGLVAINENTGIIKNIESDIAVHVGANTSNFGLKMGGATAQNLGEISIYSQNGLIERVDGERINLPNGNCSSPENGRVVYSTGTINGRNICNGSSWIPLTGASPYAMTSNDQFGGFVAFNSGLIREVEFGGHVSILDYASNTAGSISPFIAVMNGGELRDIHFRGSFSSIHQSITNFFSSFSGEINRMIIQFESVFSGVSFSSSSNIIPSSGSSEVLCIGTVTGCHTEVKYTHTAAGLTFNEYISGTLSQISGFVDLPGWDVSTNFIPDQTKTWQLEPGKSLNLMRTGGDFDKLGAGF